MSPYKSGRTQEQGMRVCVIEGRKLYVSPARFALMQKIILKAEILMQNPDEAAGTAACAAGVLPDELRVAHGRGFEVIVDRELVA